MLAFVETFGKEIATYPPLKGCLPLEMREAYEIWKKQWPSCKFPSNTDDDVESGRLCVREVV